MKKTMPIGYEDIREIIDKDLYYVDKTMMIKELLDNGGKVNLFTRPRRFGKTLNMSMIRRFFELELDESGSKCENGYIFDHLRISESGDRYLSKKEKFPVINLSLKSTRQPELSLAMTMLRRQIAKEFIRHQYVLKEDILLQTEQERYKAVMEEKPDPSLYIDSLEFLSRCLAKYHQQNVIILIDEYDVPLENSYFNGFYNEIIDFIRSLFESALKTNPHLEFAVITGCLRISKESIFTGLNNPKNYSILQPGFSDAFGFTDREIRELLSCYDLKEKYDEVREWYDGYQFGRQDVYNPWSIINYIDAKMQDDQAFPACYWSNTSSNSIVRELVDTADPKMRDDLEELLAGGTIDKPVHEDITYDDIHKSADNLWNFLFFTGYLKRKGEFLRDGTTYVRLALPNTEVRSIYQNTILSWFNQKVEQADTAPLFHAMERGDSEEMGQIISAFLLDTISFYDYAENYYHGFLAGLLSTSNRYRVSSNSESGQGRPDILLRSYNIRNGHAFILELKTVKTLDQMEEGCRLALEQIEARGYEAALRAEGYRNIRKYGICFYKKECLVQTE